METNSELTFDNMADHVESENSDIVTGSESPESLSAESAAVAGTPAPEVPAYTPNFKFKVKDKEMEFDESFRSIVKSVDDEKKIREWHEKYHGFDEIKASRDRVATEHDTYRGQVTPILQRLQAADGHLQRNDIEAFFKELEVPEAAIQEYFERKAAVGRLSPEAQAEYNRQQIESREASFYRKQAESYEAQFKQQQLSQIRNAKSLEIDQAINDPAVSGIAQAFDAQFGAGAFKNELRQRGQMAWNETKQDVPAKQIAEQMAKLFGHYAPAPVTQTPAAPMAQPTAPLKKTAPVIPAAQSTGKTPIKAGFKSFDEMEKAYKEGNY